MRQNLPDVSQAGSKGMEEAERRLEAKRLPKRREEVDKLYGNSPSAPELTFMEPSVMETHTQS